MVFDPRKDTLAMFRVNISLTHVLSILILVGTAHLTMRDSCLVGGETLDEELREQAETSLRRAAVIAEQAKQLDQSALVEKAKIFAEDPKTYKYMTLEDRPERYKFLKDKYSDISESDIEKKLGKERKKRKQEDDFTLSTEDIRHLAVYERLLVGKYRFQNWNKETQGQRNVDRTMLSRQPIRPDMVMALDSNGVGVAALGQDRYSWFGRNVAADHPSVVSTIESATSDPQLNVPRTDVWRWSWGEADDPSLYQVAIAPIRPSKQDDPAGVIVVGYSIDDGTAEKNQRLFAGLTTQKNDTVAGSNRPQSAPQVAFFRGPDIHASTFGTEREKGLQTALFDNLGVLKRDTPEKIVEFKIDDNSYIAFVRFFPGQFDVDQPAGFVILTDLSDVTRPIDSILGSIYWAGGLVLVFGLIALLVFYRRFMQPLETIEETVSEILDGNKEASFVLADDHPIFSDLAENLNRMSNFLQGKPMPDEDIEEDWDWGEDLEGQHEAQTDPDAGESPDVHGVDMGGLGGGASQESEDDTEDGDAGDDDPPQR
jgi:hypothetical protein